MRAQQSYHIKALYINLLTTYKKEEVSGVNFREEMIRYLREENDK